MALIKRRGTFRFFNLPPEGGSQVDWGFGFAMSCIIEVPNSVLDPGDETGSIRLNPAAA